MGMEEEFMDWLTDTVVIRPFASQDAYGQPVFGDPVYYKARAVGKVRLVTSLTGEEKVSTTEVVLLNSTGIDPRSEITLPEGFLPRVPQILAVQRAKDDLGRVTETLFT